MFRRRSISVDFYDAAIVERQQFIALSLLEGGPISVLEEHKARIQSRSSDGDEVIEDSRADEKGSGLHSAPILLIIAVVICGCSCQAPYEMMFARDRGCGDLISLSEYFYALILSAPGALRARWVNRQWQIPWQYHVCLAASGLGYSLLVSMAFATTTPIPVLIVLKNGNLVANLVVGVVFLRRCYSFQQVMAVLLATWGLALTTVAGQDSKKLSPEIQSNAIVGVLLLVSAVFVRAGGGALQEISFKLAGSAPIAEVHLWRSLLGLPFLIMKIGSIWEHVELWNETIVGDIEWPGMWLFLITNLVFDYLCKVTITQLICSTSALTVNMVLAFQRFVGFVLSALVFNPLVDGPSVSLWVGSIAVLMATIAYSTAPNAESNTKAKEKVA